MQYNQSVFDTVTIVTTEDDLETRRVCNKYNMNVVTTNVMFDDDAPFNKGKAINVGFREMPQSNWMAIFDADMALPSFNKILYQLDKTNIYGIPRINIGQKLNKINLPSVNSVHKTKQELFEVIIGYLQIWHSSQTPGDSIYCERSKTAQRSDTRFCHRWDASHTYRLNDLWCYHISSPRINWKGRVSPRLKVPNAHKS